MLCACNPRTAVPLSHYAAYRPKLTTKHRFPKLPFPPARIPHFATHCQNSSQAQYQEFYFDLPDDEVDQEDCPWAGAVRYKRNAAVSHVEYSTTLERLGLGKVASEVSRSRALELGLRVIGPNRDDSDGTPVVVSVDVARRKGNIRLDGVVRTVLALSCNSCGEPAAQCVFSNFSLLLSEEPVQELETIDMGTIFGQYKSNAFGTNEDDEDDDSLIDPEDHLYFPLEQKVIDISKNIRDVIHVEITMDALCGPNCKGMCLRCGANLNVISCACDKEKVEEVGYGPLGGLKKQMLRT